MRDPHGSESAVASARLIQHITACVQHFTGTNTFEHQYISCQYTAERSCSVQTEWQRLPLA